MQLTDLKRNARRIVESQPGDVEQQKKQARGVWSDAIEQFPDLLAEIIRDHADRCVWEARGQANTEIRAPRDPDKMGPTPGSRVSANTSLNARQRIAEVQSFYQWSMQGGMLGDMTKEELAKEAAQSENHERYWGRHRRFVSMVMDELPDDKAVREAISEQKLKELWRDARGPGGGFVGTRPQPAA